MNNAARNPRLFRGTVLLAGVALAGGAPAGNALAQAAGDAANTVGPVVVSGTRTATSVSDIARSITVVDREQIEEQAKVSRNLGDILAETVPGLGPSTEAATNFGQTLRGRNFLVLIDGIPQSTPLRDASRDLNTISPASIERIEVVRGGTATYGFGATGGVVNIITKEAADEPAEVYSQAGVRFSTEHFDDSLDYETTQRVSGTQGQWDYVVAGSYVERGGRFDSEGDRIPPDPLGTQGGFADTTEKTLLAKAGYEFDAGDQRVEFMVNHLDNAQDSDYTFGLSLEDGKTPAVPLDEAGAGAIPVRDPGTENTTGRISYTHRDLAGSQLDVQVYGGDQSIVFNKYPGFDQGGIDSTKYGARSTVETPVGNSGASVTWGADYLHDETSAPAFGAGAASTMPDLEQDAYAGFAEMEVPLGDMGLLRGGVRHERIGVDVSPVTNRNGNTVTSGSLDYTETLFNAGAVFYVDDRVDLFTSFSQGFSLADLGRVLRGAGPIGGGATVDPEDFEAEAQTVDNYEVGLRYYGDALSASAAVFYSQAENGGTYDDDLRLNKNDEEIWGVEAQADYAVNNRYRVGGSFTWADGQRDTASGDRVRLDGTRIAPLKLTAYVEQQATDWWRNRLQALYVGNRDEFPDAGEPSDFSGFGQGEIDSYVVLDAVSDFEAGPGTLTVSVKNLLNEDYFPAISQAFNLPTGYSKGSGRTVGVSYELIW